MPGITDIFNNTSGKASQAQIDAIRQAQAAFEKYGNQAIGEQRGAWNQGRNDLTGAYADAEAGLSPYTQAGQSSLAALLASLGMSGEGAYNDSVNQFRESPGYQFRFDQGQKAVQNQAASRGLTGSGAALKALNRYGQGVADQEFGGWQDRLTGLADQGSKLSQYLAGERMNTGRGLASLGTDYSGRIGDYYIGMGENAANSSLGQGQARASGIINRGNSWDSFLNSLVSGGIAAGGMAAGVPPSAIPGKSSNSGSGRSQRTSGNLWMDL